MTEKLLAVFQKFNLIYAKYFDNNNEKAKLKRGGAVIMLEFIVFNPVFSIIGFLIVSFIAGTIIIASMIKLFLKIAKYIAGGILIIIAVNILIRLII